MTIFSLKMSLMYKNFNEKKYGFQLLLFEIHNENWQDLNFGINKKSYFISTNCLIVFMNVTFILFHQNVRSRAMSEKNMQAYKIRK